MTTPADRARADELVASWSEFMNQHAYDRLVDVVAAALAAAYGRGRDDEAAGEPLALDKTASAQRPTVTKP